MLRSLAALAFLAASTLVIGLLAIGAGLLSPGGELMLSLGRVWARANLRAAGIHLTVRGAERVRSGCTYIFLANHQSNLDPLAIMVATPVPFRVVAKRFLFWIPIFGQAIWLLGIIPIDRAHRGRAIRSMHRAAERIRGGMSVYFFPEGTRSRDGTLLPFKKGAFVVAAQARVPVVPVVIEGSGVLWPKGSLRIRSGEMRLTFGEPIGTEGLTVQSKDRLMDAVRRQMLAGLAAG